LKCIEILEEEEKAKTISRFKEKGLISIESSSEDAWKIRNINHWFNQINDLL